MNEHAVIFILSNTERIVLEHAVPIDQLACYCETPVLLIQNTHKVILSVEDLHDTMLVFYEQLSQALLGKLRLHESIEADIGYVYNAYLEQLHHEESIYKVHNKFTIVYVQRDGVDSWVGNDYKLWGYNSIASWLYNDTDGAIIFEVTPVYLGGFGDPERKAKAIPYEEWIKDYKPDLIRTIPHSVAQQWLEQANNILKIIEKNIERERATHKDNGHA
jgi:hypothetical protein